LCRTKKDGERRESENEETVSLSKVVKQAQKLYDIELPVNKKQLQASGEQLLALLKDEVRAKEQ
jgi:3-dehydroquinate dehydratase